MCRAGGGARGLELKTAVLGFGFLLLTDSSALLYPIEWRAESKKIVCCGEGTFTVPSL